jgi:glycosyltransferase involved in cell wall biosynthesis
MENQNQKKKVLIFSLAYFPKFIGGAEIAIKEITDRCGGDFEFDMITLRFDKTLPKNEKIGNVNIYRIGPSSHLKNIRHLPAKAKFAKIIMPIIATKKALKLHRKNKYDIVWSMMANQAGFAGLFFKTFKSDVKFLLTLQEGDPIDQIKKKVRPVYGIFQKIFKSADYVQVISNHLAAFALEMGTQREKITVIPNGVDIERFKNPDQDRVVHVRKGLSARDYYIIITASRLVEKNGVADLVEAATFLDDKVRILVLGDGILYDKLIKQADKLRVTNKVIFLGQIDPTDVPNYFAAADIFIRSSWSEGLGNVFLEAMASGLPVIATHVGGIPDIITENENGLFARVKDPKDIAMKINMLIKDKELRDHLIANGYKTVEDKYDWNKVAGQMCDIFKNI